ncbi:MAG: hypothetical protein ACI4CY_02010, partial [Candidatus Gastranaerophilaceae bacterium]
MGQSINRNFDELSKILQKSYKVDNANSAEKSEQKEKEEKSGSVFGAVGKFVGSITAGLFSTSPKVDSGKKSSSSELSSSLAGSGNLGNAGDSITFSISAKETGGESKIGDETDPGDAQSTKEASEAEMNEAHGVTDDATKFLEENIKLTDEQKEASGEVFEKTDDVYSALKNAGVNAYTMPTLNLSSGAATVGNVKGDAEYKGIDTGKADVFSQIQDGIKQYGKELGQKGLAKLTGLGTEETASKKAAKEALTGANEAGAEKVTSENNIVTNKGQIATDEVDKGKQTEVKAEKTQEKAKADTQVSEQTQISQAEAQSIQAAELKIQKAQAQLEAAQAQLKSFQGLLKVANAGIKQANQLLTSGKAMIAKGTALSSNPFTAAAGAALIAKGTAVEAQGTALMASATAQKTQAEAGIRTSQTNIKSAQTEKANAEQEKTTHTEKKAQADEKVAQGKEESAKA